MKSMGIDGCHGGWLAVWTEDGAGWECALHPTMADLWTDHADTTIMFADIPIGLPGTGSRQADAIARQRLGQRSSSVFSVPVRPAALAMGRDNMTLTERKAMAKEINRQLSGKSLSEQTLGIVPKIIEMDAFLHATPEARGRVFEAHPELCFSLAAGAPMIYAKREFLGGLERLRLVRQWIPRAQDMLASVRSRHARSMVDADDVLDAMILAASAHSCQGRPASMPDPPERDETGLPMAIWYHDFNNCRGFHAYA
jgi:predicted RNase H-like nuclease